ncbi:MAG: hypothetical protein WAU36_12230 [Cyclobacteriaceae bacterium]
MNTYFLIAGILCFILGIVHSILGEVLIFKDKRNNGSIIPSKNSTELKERHLRIIWATWHLASVLGWCIGIILVRISLEQKDLSLKFIEMAIQPMIYTMFAGAFLVLIGTKGKHPGWVVLLLIGILLLIAN